MKRIISLVITVCMLAASVFAAPARVGVESAAEYSETALDELNKGELMSQVTSASFIGNPDFDTSRFGELFLYEDYQNETAGQDANVSSWTFADKCFQSDTFKKISGLNVNSSTPGVYTQEGTNVYKKMTQNINQWSFINNGAGAGCGVRIAGANMPKGYYTVVFDAKLHEAGAVKYNYSLTNNKWDYDMPKYTEGEWITLSASFIMDGNTSDVTVREQFKYNTNDTSLVRNVDLDNFAIYYLPDRTITFNDGAATNEVIVSGQYLTAEQVSEIAIPTKAGFNFKGWSETEDGAIISDLATYYTATSRELYAVWEEKTQEGLFRNEFDTSKLGELFLYDDFGIATGSWNLGKDRSGNNFCRGESFTKTTGLNAHLQVQKAVWTEDGYYTVKDTVSTYSFTNLYGGFTLSGATLPKGTYTTVIDLKFHEADATKIGFGRPGANHEDMVNVGAYTQNEWNTYSRTFYSDGTLNGNIGSVVAWSTSSQGQERTFDYDNFALYYLPDRTITFEVDSAMGTVSESTLAVSGQYADLSGITVTPANEQVVFLGWTVKDGDGSIINAETTQFYTAKDVTLKAVFEDSSKAPVTNESVQIRTRTPMGIRSIATVSYEQRNDAVEYGYIVALTNALNGEELTFESTCKKISGVSYNKNGIDKIFDDDFENERVAFSGVFTGIPKTREAYITALTFRPYIKYSDGTYYGKAISKSLYEAACAIKESEGFDSMPESYKNTVNEIINLGKPPFITNGNAEEADNVAFTSPNANVSIIDDTRFGGNKVYNVEATNAGKSWTYFLQEGVEYVEGKRYNVSFDICYTGYADQTVTDTSDGSFAVNFRYNDKTDSTTSFKDHVVYQFTLKKGEWKRVTCSYVVSNLEDNSVSQFAIYANPFNQAYSRNFMVDNIVVEMSDEYQFELMGKTYDEQGNEKDPTSFAVGEKATFKVGVYEGSEMSSNCKWLKYTVSYDDGQANQTAVVDATGGEITIETKALTKPGAIRCVVSVCDENGNLLKVNNANEPSGLSYHFNGGVIAGFDEIRLSTVDTSAEKASVNVANPDGILVMEESFDRTFDEFWAEKLATIEGIDYSTAQIKEVSNAGGFTVYEVYIPFAIDTDEDNMAAFYMTVPTAAQVGSLGVLGSFQGYGIASPAQGKRAGHITVTVSAHSMLLGQDASYYSSLGLEGYGVNRDGKETTPDESYFVGMILRDMVAVNFAKQYAVDGNVLFDGENIKLSGGSQGAFQSVAVAALLGEEATNLELMVPWMCDINGVNVGRISAEFKPTATPTRSHAYFDTGLFAKRVTCDATVKVGLGDYTCPPSGIIAMYHNLGSANKSITLHQNMVHSQTALPLSNGMSYTYSN